MGKGKGKGGRGEGGGNEEAVIDRNENFLFQALDLTVSTSFVNNPPPCGLGQFGSVLRFLGRLGLGVQDSASCYIFSRDNLRWSISRGCHVDS